jgi:hypothetical protein
LLLASADAVEIAAAKYLNDESENITAIKIMIRGDSLKRKLRCLILPSAFSIHALAA